MTRAARRPEELVAGAEPAAQLGAVGRRVDERVEVGVLRAPHAKADERDVHADEEEAPELVGRRALGVERRGVGGEEGGVHRAGSLARGGARVRAVDQRRGGCILGRAGQIQHRRASLAPEQETSATRDGGRRRGRRRGHASGSASAPRWAG